MNLCTHASVNMQAKYLLFAVYG